MKNTHKKLIYIFKTMSRYCYNNNANNYVCSDISYIFIIYTYHYIIYSYRSCYRCK